MKIILEDCIQEVETNKAELEEILPKYIDNMQKDNIKTLAFLWRRENVDSTQLIIEIEQAGGTSFYAVYGYRWDEDRDNKAESLPDKKIGRSGPVLRFSIEL